MTALVTRAPLLAAAIVIASAGGSAQITTDAPLGKPDAVIDLATRDGLGAQLSFPANKVA